MLTAMEGFPWQTFSVSSAGWVLVAAFVWMLMVGRVVPRQQYEDILRDRDQWRQESQGKDQLLSEQSAQLREMAEVGETAKALMLALGKVTERRGGP